MFTNGTDNFFVFANTEFVSFRHLIYPFTPGNWSPSDFPEGSTFSSYEKTHASVNRDLLVVMSGDTVVGAFQTVFQNDWGSGTDWKPKH